tara:strand:- start:304 stop:819 length:516 start_codon:yes stop_codon:yes gene_type:complete
MAIREILEFPDPRLRIVATPVKTFDINIKKLVDDMFETMYAASGIGLAATQINDHQRVIVIDLQGEDSQPLVIINPEIEIKTDQKDEVKEGCLSIPGFHEVLKRPNLINLKGADENGFFFEREAHGLLAVCIQHEFDHLEGKLIIDYLSGLKRDRIRRKLLKQKRMEILDS